MRLIYYAILKVYEMYLEKIERSMIQYLYMYKNNQADTSGHKRFLLVDQCLAWYLASKRYVALMALEIRLFLSLILFMCYISSNNTHPAIYCSPF